MPAWENAGSRSFEPCSRRSSASMTFRWLGGPLISRIYPFLYVNPLTAHDEMCLSRTGLKKSPVFIAQGVVGKDIE
jgi:hypothetical protein